jgi:hypothetical protein
MSKQLSAILTLGIVFLIALVPNTLSPQPAQADTLNDIGKAIGVWQRFMQDLQRTQSQTTPPDRQPTPTTQPENPTPLPNSDEPEETDVT